MKKALCLSIALILSAGLLRLQAQETAKDAIDTLKQSLEVMRGSYTADITLSSADLELKEMPTISYKQRVFADGNADFQASMERVPLPDGIPESLGEIPLKFVSTSEGTGLQLDNAAVLREGRAPEFEEGIVKAMTAPLNEIPMPTAEELEAMDLRQETEVINGVPCQTISWIPDDYRPDAPKSVAMHCLSFGIDDHILHAYVALDKDGKELFSLKFANVDLNPSFGPEDFRLDPDVKLIKVDNDEDFGRQTQNLFIAKFIKAAITPKGKRRRTAGGNSVQTKTVAPKGPQPAPVPQPPPPERNSFAGFYFVLAGLLALLLLLLLLMRRRK